MFDNVPSYYLSANMYVWELLCFCTHLCVCLSAWRCLYVCACRTRICVPTVCVYVCTCVSNTCACVCVCVSAHMFMCMCVCVCVCVCTFVSVCELCVCLCVHVCLCVWVVCVLVCARVGLGVCRRMADWLRRPCLPHIEYQPFCISLAVTLCLNRTGLFWDDNQVNVWSRFQADGRRLIQIVTTFSPSLSLSSVRLYVFQQHR